ncbi:hypothetical protein Dimus_030626, partial [Dionaea muscipula]
EEEDSRLRSAARDVRHWRWPIKATTASAIVDRLEEIERVAVAAIHWRRTVSSDDGVIGDDHVSVSGESSGDVRRATYGGDARDGGEARGGNVRWRATASSQQPRSRGRSTSEIVFIEYRLIYSV